MSCLFFFCPPSTIRSMGKSTTPHQLRLPSKSARFHMSTPSLHVRLSSPQCERSIESPRMSWWRDSKAEFDTWERVIPRNLRITPVDVIAGRHPAFFSYFYLPGAVTRTPGPFIWTFAPSSSAYLSVVCNHLSMHWLRCLGVLDFMLIHILPTGLS